MEAGEDIEGMTVAVAQAGPAMPYAFARDRGVLVESLNDTEVTVALREGGDPLALLEIRDRKSVV